MKTSDFLSILHDTDQPLNFRLPDGEIINGDLHITEVKNVTVDSTDCGGFKHSFQETVVQLWLDENSGKQESWTTSKAAKIFDIVGKQRDHLLDAEAFIEFGDSSHLTSKYAINLLKDDASLTIQLQKIFPKCKPRSLNQSACC